jgi:RHS repeat-associated protein
MNRSSYTGPFCVKRTGPDEVETWYKFDALGRVEHVRRGPIEDPLLEAWYVYLDNGLLATANYGSAPGEVPTARTVYGYDLGNRVTFISHQESICLDYPCTPTWAIQLQMQYTYNGRNLPTWINEGGSQNVYYTYDDLGRLRREVRQGSNAYDIRYWYDAGGNRTRKEDRTNPSNIKKDVYVYDLSNPSNYDSANNRLMRVEHLAGVTHESTTYYTYTPYGNVHRVINVPEEPEGGGGVLLLGGGPESMSMGEGEGGAAMMSGGVVCGEDEFKVTATRFEYAQNASAVTYAIGEEWCWDAEEENPCAAVTQYEVTFAREFRYDGARARYLSAELDVASFKQGSFVHTTRKWTDFDGDNAYRDRMMTPGELAYATGFEPGIGRIRDMAGTPLSDYYFADHLGTTRRTYGPSGGSSSSVFTAFGEPRSATLDGGDNRYGYVGAHGYQAHDEMPFLHVGHRYYDPSIGRFLQRDPIGMFGGLNVYMYVFGRPTSLVDPWGLQSTHPREVARCEEACNDWREGGGSVGCGVSKGITNCISSCNDGYWPPAPAPPKPEHPFGKDAPWEDWPDKCPPVSVTPAPVEDGRPGGGPSGCGGGGGRGGAAAFVFPFVVLATLRAKRRIKCRGVINSKRRAAVTRKRN